MPPKRFTCSILLVTEQIFHGLRYVIHILWPSDELCSHWSVLCMIINLTACIVFNKQKLTLNYIVFEVVIWHLIIFLTHSHTYVRKCWHKQHTWGGTANITESTGCRFSGGGAHELKMECLVSSSLQREISIRVIRGSAVNVPWRSTNNPDHVQPVYSGWSMCA